MNKECAQGVFIRFIDFRSELIIRASAVDGLAPLEKDKATCIFLNGNRVTVELPFEQVSLALRAAQNISTVKLDTYTEITCKDTELSDANA
ncbi:hypothetical protein [Citrobacter sp. TSA-1]|uniref:hypothetical protein n=1 Tax=Citrobacter sp. TSA-1 TaxID=184912 RepID=UPI000BAE4E7F|nr:hypothetical protein [Citrobacter sp. TSA-1]PAX78146.1 hypothetical protein CIK43_19140 [Citrobacter sp. TSA-1]QKE19520.1 hypothetical protein HF677_007495 [Citrobacter sp. TSA-1]